MLASMAATLAPVARLATAGGGWTVRAYQFGRAATLVLFGMFELGSPGRSAVADFETLARSYFRLKFLAPGVQACAFTFG